MSPRAPRRPHRALVVQQLLCQPLFLSGSSQVVCAGLHACPASLPNTPNTPNYYCTYSTVSCLALTPAPAAPLLLSLLLSFLFFFPSPRSHSSPLFSPATAGIAKCRHSRHLNRIPAEAKSESPVDSRTPQTHPSHPIPSHYPRVSASFPIQPAFIISNLLFDSVLGFHLLR